MQVGFEAVDLLARENSLTWGRKLTHKALTAEGHIRGCRVVLCKPMTFMNVSGESVAPIAKKHGIPTSQVLTTCGQHVCLYGAHAHQGGKACKAPCRACVSCAAFLIEVVLCIEPCRGQNEGVSDTVRKVATRSWQRRCWSSLMT